MTTDRSDGPLLVPIANPETVDRLLDTAIDVARARSISIVAVHVVEVPQQLPLSAGPELVEEQETSLLEYASERASEADVDLETKTRFSRDVASGIVGSVDAADGSAMLVGWRGRPRRRDIVLGSFLDRILGEAPCDVYVKRIKLPSRSPDSVLVPVAGGPHDELAAELAGTIAAQHDATITLYHVDRNESGDEPEALFDERRAAIPDDVTVETVLVRADHVASAITDETVNHDLTVLGATREPFLSRKLVGSVAQGVGRTAANSVVVTRRYLEDGPD